MPGPAVEPERMNVVEGVADAEQPPAVVIEEGPRGGAKNGKAGMLRYAKVRATANPAPIGTGQVDRWN